MSLPLPNTPSYVSALEAALQRSLTPSGNATSFADYTGHDLPMLTDAARDDSRLWSEIPQEEREGYTVLTYVDCTLDECDATLNGSIAEGLLLIRCSLRKSSFSYDNSSPRLLDCDLTEADFSNATEISPVFVGCNLTRADFRYATLAHPTFIDCVLDDALFASATLHSPLFVRSNAALASLHDSTFTKPYALPAGYRFQSTPGALTSDTVTLDSTYLEAEAVRLGLRPDIISALLREHPFLVPPKVLALAQAIPSKSLSTPGVR